MADIDKITASNGTTYNIKDSTARDSISLAYVPDLDTLIGSFSIKRYNTTAANKPTDDSWGVVIGADQAQLAFGGNSGKIYTRRYSDSSWGAWKVVVPS